MLYYQLPLFFFLGAILYLYPGIGKMLGIAYLACVVINFIKHPRL